MGSKLAISFLVVIMMAMVVDVYSQVANTCSSPWVQSVVDAGVCLRRWKRGRSFNKARRFCQSQGGDLATTLIGIDDMELVLGNKGWGHYWIGYRFSNVLLATANIYGAIINIAPFREGRGFDFTELDPIRQCVSVKNKEWVDSECRKKYGFVCAKAMTTT